MKNMYAITFDLNQEMLEKTYGKENFNNTYADIKRVLTKYGFERQQGSVYFSKEQINSVTCMIAVQDIAKQYKWFGVSLEDIRMLKIEDNNDLMPAIEMVL